MRIIFVQDSNPFYNNSAYGNRYAGIIEGLIKCGIQVSLLIIGGYNNKKEKENDGYPISYIDKQLLEVSYTLKLDNSNKWIKRAKIYFFNKILLIANSILLKSYFKQRCDFCFWGNNAASLYLYNKYFEANSVCSVMEINEFDDIFYNKKLNRFQYRASVFYKSEFDKAIRNIDCFAFMTKALMDYYAPKVKNDARLLHLPMTVDLKRFNNCTADSQYSKPYIAYTGSFSNAKDGIDVLLKAFAIISKKYESITLYLAGFYHPDVLEQQRYVRENQIEERVKYIGSLTKEQIPAFICNADLLVLSRPDSHQAQGGFPTKLGEYLATGNPVCVTKVGEIPDYLEDNVSAFMATPGDVDSFADAMDRALSNPDNAKKVGLAGRKVAEREFNSEIQAKRLYEFLQENL